jgi:site-specific DNA-adenine methylase
MKYDLLGNITIPKDIKNFRFPYMGSKNKIAVDLLREMLKVKPKAKYFYDLCGGGGSLSFTASQIGLKTHYNELQTSLVNFIDYIFNRLEKGLKGQYGLFPDDFYNFIDRDEFMKLKNEDSIKGQFARICYSFGNNQKSYLFGDIEKTKHLAHDVVMFKCEKSLKKFNNLLGTDIKISNLPTWNERRLNFMKQAKHRKYKELERLQQLERLKQLERLEQLQNLNQLHQLQPIFTTSNLSYKDVKINTPIEETIIYIDPPYRNTEKYIEGKDFNYKELDQWFLDNKYTCFMSEYNAPHKVLFEIDKLSLMDNSKEKKKVVKEKLYINQ